MKRLAVVAVSAAVAGTAGYLARSERHRRLDREAADKRVGEKLTRVLDADGWALEGVGLARAAMVPGEHLMSVTVSTSGPERGFLAYVARPTDTGAPRLTVTRRRDK